MKSGREIATLNGHTTRVFDLAFSPDGQRLASAGEDGTIRVWDVNARQKLLTLNGHTSWVKSVVFSPDGQCLASASHDHTVKIWGADSGNGREKGAG